MRAGLGYDIHRLEAERRLVLGGVEIPHNKGMAGHSDGDALAHAITDALLGALGWGDIGQWFPDTDPAHKDADSMTLLRQVGEEVRKDGYAIVNIDANVIAEAPKLGPHIGAIRESLANCLELAVAQVSVKAKTNETVGPAGRQEAIVTQAVVLVAKMEDTTGSG